MMLENDTFQLNIPTHIKFTLYKYDHIDSIIISRVLRECRNWSTDEDSVYLIKASEFKEALINSKRLSSYFEKAKTYGLALPPSTKPNTIFFLSAIFKNLTNLEWMSFDISCDKNFTRLVRIENKEVLSFYFKIQKGVFDLTKLYDRNTLDSINKKIIEFGIMPNKYLNRNPYFYLKTSVLFDILTQMGIESFIDMLDNMDQKLEEDDPLLLVITDYTSY